jgi:hypothetical protein
VVDKAKDTSDKAGNLDVMTSLETLTLIIFFTLFPLIEVWVEKRRRNLKLRGGWSGAITTNNKRRMGKLFKKQMKAIDCKLVCISKCNKKEFSIMQVGKIKCCTNLSYKKNCFIIIVQSHHGARTTKVQTQQHNGDL